MSNKCAFCRKENVTFTKEHVFPKCIYEKTPEQNLQSLPSGKIVEAQLTIKDVCSKCNNGILSELDNYFCKLFDSNMSRFVYPGEKIDFEYDFDILARWLLKISYNSARAMKSDYELLSKFTNYILHNTNRPNGLSIFVQLIIPYRMKKEMLETFPRADELKQYSKTGDLLFPTFSRIGQVELRKGTHKFKAGRMVTINSYYFYLLLCPENVSEKSWKKLLLQIPTIFPGSTQLKRMKQKALLKASNVTTLEANQGLIKKHELAYNEWKSKKSIRRNT